MGGGGPAGGGFKVPHVSRVHKGLATGFGAMAWFWMFYRAKQDGAHMFGLADPPWVADVKKERMEAAEELTKRHE